MALNYSQITFLKQLDKNCIHGKNILAKNDKNNIENFYNEYNSFINSMNIKKLKHLFVIKILFIQTMLIPIVN